MKIFPATLVLLLALQSQVWGAVEIRDDRGETITLASPPQRIISLYGGLTEILAALGVAPSPDRTSPSPGESICRA